MYVCMCVCVYVRRASLWIRFRYWLTSMIVITVYATPLPIIYICTLIKQVLVYWIERYSIYNVYQEPPALDQRMPYWARTLLPVGLVMKLCMMFIIYADQSGYEVDGMEQVLSLTLSFYLSIYVSHTHIHIYVHTLSLSLS